MGSISTIHWKRPRVEPSSNSTHFDRSAAKPGLGLARTSHLGDSAPATTVTVAPNPVGPGVDRDADVCFSCPRTPGAIPRRRLQPHHPRGRLPPSTAAIEPLAGDRVQGNHPAVAGAVSKPTGRLCL